MQRSERRLAWPVLAVFAALILAGGATAVERHYERTKSGLAATLTGGDPAKAPWLMTRYGCAGCHTIGGLPGADGQVGPPLSGLIERVYIGGGAPNTAENLVAWLVNPQRFAPHAAMPPPGLNETEARDIAAYLYSH